MVNEETMVDHQALYLYWCLFSADTSTYHSCYHVPFVCVDLTASLPDTASVGRVDESGVDRAAFDYQNLTCQSILYL